MLEQLDSLCHQNTVVSVWHCWHCLTWNYTSGGYISLRTCHIFPSQSRCMIDRHGWHHQVHCAPWHVAVAICCKLAVFLFVSHQRSYSCEREPSSCQVMHRQNSHPSVGILVAFHMWYLECRANLADRECRLCPCIQGLGV